MHNLVWFYPHGHEDHFLPGHPESPERLEVIRAALLHQGWWQDFPQLDPINLAEQTLQGVHSAAYLARLERACRGGLYLDADTYTCTTSWELALQAACGAAAVAQSVWRGKAGRGFALTRPPGHHATRERGMGFCLLNNIALAAEHLLQQEGARRLAIVDLDLHHGNGTQDIFYTRGEVFYFSTHQYPHYPGTGALDETGFGPGEGATANFPLPPFSGDRAFLTIMDQLILPLLDRFQPEMVLVSYGFDPHWSDPLGNLRLSAPGYHRLIERLAGWSERNCSGRLALFLEGGYDMDAARACTLAVTAALLGEPWQAPEMPAAGPSPYPESASWETMFRRARELWKF
jgi:acetoin utilization deacetylase AcuC-like enzyme